MGDAVSEEGDDCQEDKLPKGRRITEFSSGTGLAGVVGVAWKVVLLTQWLALSLRFAHFLAFVLRFCIGTRIGHILMLMYR
jgi:hypothetical protein